MATTETMGWSGVRRGGRRPSHGLSNWLKTGVLLAGLTALCLVIGQAIGGSQGLVIALIFAMTVNVISYWFSDRIALAAYRARPLPRESAPEVHAIVERLARKAELPVPPLYLVDSPVPNAFATGRNPSHAAVAVTTGILQRLDARELEGVLAHELSHVRNRDTLVSTVAATLAGLITGVAAMLRWTAILGGGRDRDSASGLQLLALAIVAPIAAMLLQFAVSRSREYGADESGARLCGDPAALADALGRLESANRAHPDDRHPATASLWVVNPLSGRGFTRLMSTHPPTEERIARLLAMARPGGWASR